MSSGTMPRTNNEYSTINKSLLDIIPTFLVNAVVGQMHALVTQMSEAFFILDSSKPVKPMKVR